MTAVLSVIAGSNLSLTSAPNPASVSGTGAGPAVSTGNTNATAVGGVGPYTYLWSRTDTNPGSWNINSPTSPITGFTAVGLVSPSTVFATFSVTVTDSIGSNFTSQNVGAGVSRS